MSERPRRGKSALEGKGYYIILFLCVAAIGVCGYFLTRELLAVRTGGFGQEPAAAVSGQAQLEDQREAIRKLDEKLSQKKKAEETAQAPEQEPAAGEAASPDKDVQPEPEAAQSAEWVWPVGGAVDRGFSLEVFAYDATMGDWRTHDGLDIAADPGSAVGACGPGTVESVENDDMLGVTVTVDHGAGLKSVYANLDEAVDVDAGDPVEAGTVIGTVGATAISESAGPSHLHFAMKEYGVAVDPMNYLQ